MSAPKAEWTTQKLLEWATSDFGLRKFSDARLAAEILLARALETDRVGIYLKFDHPVGENERAKFRDFVEKRRRGMPVAYIIGEKEFYSLSISVDPRVLIPRPETEMLVDEVRAYAGKLGSAPKICDVGTGSGAIALALKKNLPDSVVTALDHSQDALDVATQNAERHQLAIHFVKSDLLNGVEGDFDITVANLPYIRSDEIETLAIDVKAFEPELALDGGSLGLDLIERLIGQVMRGALFLEVGIGQSASVQAKMLEKGFKDIHIRNDFAGVPRVVWGQRG